MMVGDAAMLIKKARPSRKNRKSPQGAGRTRFKSNQVPLIPASRGHNYANDLPPPASWFPPVIFFFCNPPQRPTQQYSARLVPTLPSSRRLHYPVLRPFYLSLILVWALAIYLGSDRVPFSRAFRVESRSGFGLWNVGWAFRQSVMAIATVTASAVALVGVVIAAVPFAV